MNRPDGVFKILQNSNTRAPITFLISGILIQVFWYIQLWSSLVKDAALNSMDFVSLYSAGIVAKTHGLMNTYDVNLQQIIQRNIIGPDFVSSDTLRFNHPPYLLPFLVKISSENYPLSYILWSVLLILLVGVSVLFIVRTLISSGFSNKNAVVMGAVGALYYPVFMSILKGQDTALLLLGVSIWMYALVLRKDSLAGMGLALATIKPQIALVIAIPFIFNRRRVWWGFCIGSAILIIYSVLLVGIEGMRELFEILLLSAGGENYGLNQNQMFNLLGLLLRTFPAIDPGFVINLGWGAFLLAIIGLSYLWKQANKKLPETYFGLAVIVGLFVSPHLHFHDLSLLIIPAAWFALMLYREKVFGEIWAVNLVLLNSLILLIAGVLPPPWLHAVSYLSLFGLAIGFLLIKNVHLGGGSSKSR